MIKYVVLFAVVVASGLRAGSPDLSGEWAVVATFDAASRNKSAERRIELVCTFQQHDASVTGSCRPASGPEGVPVSGTVHDKNVVWSFQIAPNETATKQTASFRGSLGRNRSAMNGAFTFCESRGDFQARKQ